jgi:Na+-driven multidrug efflux pump
MGLAGAAIATGISQVISFGIVAMHFVLKRGVLRVSRFRFEGALVKKVLLRGSPEMLSQLTTPIMTLCMNAMVMKYLGNNGINAYSVISYVTSLAFAVILGVAEGMQPLFGQRCGERNAPDLKYYYKAGWGFSLIGSLIIYALAIVTGRGICELFGADAAATGMAVLALPKYGWLFMFAALNTLIAAYLYSTRRTKESMVVNALRAFVFIPACVLGITTVSSGALVWFAVGFAEVLSFISATGIVHHSERNGFAFRSE